MISYLIQTTKPVRISTILILLACFCTNHGQAQSIKDLEFLIGEWDADELVFPGKPNEYNEVGVRTCDYYMDSTYVRCFAKSMRKGRDREYEYLFNYVKETGLFRITCIYSDFDFRGGYTGALNSDTKELHLITDRSDDDKKIYRSKIIYTDRDRLLWRGYRADYTVPEQWEAYYEEVAIRKK